MLVEVHRELSARRYLTTKFSCANGWRIFSDFAVVVLTLTVSFVSQGLWRRTGTYLEQPKITFTNRFILVTADRSPDHYRFWSSYADLNEEYESDQRLATPSVRSRHVDWNADGIADEILIDIDLRFSENLNQTFNVFTVFYVLEFDVRLERRALVEMRGRLFGHIERLISGESVSVLAQLSFVQRHTLPSYGTVFIVDANPHNSTSNEQLQFDGGQYFFEEILAKNFEQNYTVALEGKTESWRPLVGHRKNSSNASFGAQFRLAVREQTLTYRTGALELLKWAWLQYLGILVIVRCAAQQVNAFLYENQILSTIVREDTKFKFT